MEEKFRILLDRMMVLCSKREYCEADIRKRLEKEALKSGYPEEPGIWQQAVDGIVDTLKREKYIDDSRYAKAFVRDKSSISGWGRVKIRHGLIAKGVARSCVDEALAEMEGNPGMDKLARALELKYRNLKDDPYVKFKLLRYALGRGYEYDEVKGLVDGIVKM